MNKEVNTGRNFRNEKRKGYVEGIKGIKWIFSNPQEGNGIKWELNLKT
jgi:hypothetical protein